MSSCMSVRRRRAAVRFGRRSRMAAEIGRSRAGRSSRQEAKRAGSEASSRDRQAAKRAVGSVGALAGNRPATNSGGSKRASCSVPFSLKGHERHLVERHGRVRLQISYKIQGVQPRFVDMDIERNMNIWLRTLIFQNCQDGISVQLQLHPEK